MADIEFVLGLGKEHFTGVVIGQRLALDDGFTAVAFAEQHLRLVLTLPAEQHGTTAILEQQQRRHGNRGDRIELALQQPPLQTGAGRSPGQQVGGQLLCRQWQTGGQHRRAGGLLVQGAESQQPVE